ncbi:MAG: 5'-nucleotidase/3'-nucleotidase/exopolyphosphatase [Candidatus Aminicenantes bacterium]|nr:5'-nucleotidase/3'-nucleotidase/exopolyphosphatase [Candidatus Aminicenantes bacterium]
MRYRRRALGIAILALVFAAACGGTSNGPAPESLNILVTNDDGIEAPGILALAEALRPLGTVTVAASGINRGENLGTVTFYSATVGAAREAAFLGLPAMAVNLATPNGASYETAAAAAAAIARALGKNGIARGVYLNVNVPPLPRERLKGIRITRQDTRAPVDFFKKSAGPDGTVQYTPGWQHLDPAGPDTDIWAVRNGYVSVSVFGFDQSAAVPPSRAGSLKRLESLSLR